jgi:hypothetical protein
VSAAEKRQVANAGVTGDLDFGVGVGGVGAHAVDIGRLQARVGNGGRDGLARQAQLAAT